MYTCPVCAYDQLRQPPENFLICPSCGTEFGNDDFATSHEDLREQWIAAGASWFSGAVHPPAGWDGIVQLVKAGLLTAVGEARPVSGQEACAAQDKPCSADSLTVEERERLWDAIIAFANHDHRWTMRPAVEAALDAYTQAVRAERTPPAPEPELREIMTAAGFEIFDEDTPQPDGTCDHFGVYWSITPKVSVGTQTPTLAEALRDVLAMVRDVAVDLHAKAYPSADSVTVEEAKKRVVAAIEAFDCAPTGDSRNLTSAVMYQELDALIAAVRAEGAAQIEQLEAENQRLREQLARATS